MSISDDDVRRVWEKGRVVPGFDPSKYRKDECGAWMDWSKYGDRNNDFGWEIDHIRAVTDGGTDNLSNLHPLQWENNSSKSDGRLTCPVTSNGNSNTRRAGVR